MKTTFIKIKNKKELPKGIVTNTTLQNLFGCLYTDTKDKVVKLDKGLLETKTTVRMYKEVVNTGFLEMLNEEEIEFSSTIGTFTYKRKANLIVYYKSLRVNNYE